jgi:hypothetical protein
MFVEDTRRSTYFFCRLIRYLRHFAQVEGMAVSDKRDDGLVMRSSGTHEVRKRRCGVASVVWLGEGSGNVLATRIQKKCCGDKSYRLVGNRQTTTHDYFIFCSVVLVAVSWPDIDLAATAML